MKMRRIEDRYSFISKKCDNKTVLDLGVVGENYKIHSNRTPWLHLYIKEYAKELIGLDSCSETNRDEAQNISGTQILFGDATNFNLNRTFDVIVGGELIEHLDNFRDFFGSVKKHMNKESIFIISTPNCFAFDNLINALFFGKTKHHPGHIVYFDKGTLKELLENHGFEVKEVFYGTELELSIFKAGLIRLLGSFRKIYNKDITFVCSLK